MVDICFALEKLGIKFKKAEPMSKHTSFKIGGPADYYVAPRTMKEMMTVLITARKLNLDFYIIGNGSNVLFKDEGFKGLVIDTSLHDEFSFGLDGEITAHAGTNLTKLALCAKNNGFTGLEFAYGIPGTVGGAIVMNAGAYGGEMKDVCKETYFITKEGEAEIVKGEAHEFCYRDSIFKKNGGLIFASILKLTKGDPAEIEKLTQANMDARKEKQPLNFPSAGSAFKRPQGYFAAKLIEDCGLKGKRIGGAEVSEKHAGFIINKGGATAKDVIALLEFVKETVNRETGVTLEPEIIIV